VTWGISAVLMGGLSDRFGRRRIMIPAIVAFSLMSCFSGAATGFAALLRCAA
jgi:MFS family permease